MDANALAQRTQDAFAARQAIEGGVPGVIGQSTQNEGLFEKPTNDADKLRGYYDTLSEKYFGNMTPEQRKEMEEGAREYMKKVLGVKDTEDLNTESQRMYETYRDWFLGKISK